MSYEVLSAVAAMGTFVVITATAIAAMIQLGHLRSSNQLQALTSFAHEFEGVAQHLSFVYNDLPAKMQDPAFRREIAGLLSPDRHPELRVAIFFDRVGMLIRLGLMHERFVMEHGAGATAILKGWHSLEGVVALRRRFAPNAYRNAEYLAVRAQAWLERYPQGTFSTTEPRLPIVDRWASDDVRVETAPSPD